MSKPKTDAASKSEVVAGDEATSNNPELLKLEKAIKAEAGEEKASETSSDDSQETGAPHGQAFQQLAEKKGFDSVDDLVRAYENVESSSTRLSQELKGIRDEIRSVKETPQKEDPYADLPKEQQQALNLLRTVVNEEIDKNLSPIREDFEVRRASRQLEEIRDRFPNASDADLDAAITYKEQNNVSLEDAVKITTYEAARSDGTTKRKRAAKSQQKKRAYVESAKTHKKRGDIDYSKLSLEELENILPSAGQFVDSSGKMRAK